MTKQARALTRQMERLIETALMPGRFISDNASFSFVRDLEVVEQRLSKCLPANPVQAVGLYETFLAGCYEKAGEIDDSSGTFGDCVGQIHCANEIEAWAKKLPGPANADPSRIGTSQALMEMRVEAELTAIVQRNYDAMVNRAAALDRQDKVEAKGACAQCGG